MILTLGLGFAAHADSKLIFNVDFDTSQRHPLDIARAYLKHEARSLGLPADLSNLAEPVIQESLLAHHFRFQQIEQGLPVEDAQIILSIDKESHEIMKVYSTLVPRTAPRIDMSATQLLTQPTSTDLAWNHLRVHGELNDFVRSDLVMVQHQGTLIPAYREFIHTTAPEGNWRVTIDARTGEILSTEDTRVFRSKMRQRLAEFGAHAGPIVRRWKAEADFLVKTLRKKLRYSNGGSVIEQGPLAETRANGTALIFNPDPATKLKSKLLRDTSQPASFEGAYEEKTLRDITLSNGTYILKGPWVQIQDFDSPTSQPSTSKTGAWTAKRGDNAFDDAMVYFHIDESQRYIQSLGFKEKTGIQATSIEADSNGADGADNSFFSPLTNQLAFGHGCINDSEDADVILHEYGHAIQHGINPNWNGGDTRAMGEGFGDYWAASYSIRENLNPDYDLGRVFNWDAADSCWPGRRVDKKNAFYSPGRTYYDHEQLQGFVSDELWSTPLFQALLELRKQGVPQSEVDQIILESHFGLGSGIRMPDMAKSTLAVAGRLFPNGPHRKVFLERFAHHKILNARDVTLP